MAESRRLTAVADVDGLLDRSRIQPVLVFKHSRTCGISAMAWEQWQAFLKSPDAEEVYCTHLIVQDDRPVSNEIADRLRVRHESPQAILIIDGQAHWHTSHMAITRDRLVEAVAAAPAPGAGTGAREAAGAEGVAGAGGE